MVICQKNYIIYIDTICDNYCLTYKNEFNKQTDDFLNDWLYRLFKTVNEKQGER